MIASSMIDENVSYGCDLIAGSFQETRGGLAGTYRTQNKTGG